jgi:hypothetical protein
LLVKISIIIFFAAGWDEDPANLSAKREKKFYGSGAKSRFAFNKVQ